LIDWCFNGTSTHGKGTEELNRRYNLAYFQGIDSQLTSSSVSTQQICKLVQARGSDNENTHSSSPDEKLTSTNTPQDIEQWELKMCMLTADKHKQKCTLFEWHFAAAKHK